MANMRCVMLTNPPPPELVLKLRGLKPVLDEFPV